MTEKPDIKKIKESFLEKLKLQFNVTPDEASDKQIYQVLSSIVVEILKTKRQKFINRVHSEGKKQVYYLSMEFLMGRSLKTSLYNLEIVKDVEKMLKEYGFDLSEVACIGDQIMTDIWGANRMGFTSILVDKMTKEDFKWTKLNRIVECLILKHFHHKKRFTKGEYYE